MNRGDLDAARLARTLANARARLLDERVAAGHWEGELSSSALSTATAALALQLHARTGAPGGDACAALAARGRAWLAARQNADGGWGDTSDSPSNVSTTALAWTALGVERAQPGEHAECLRRAEARLRTFVGSTEPGALARALLAAYGDDRTFSVPILVACALGGRLGEGREAWSAIPAIPFELAALPHGLYQHLGLPMVSYALPALIAIGQVLHHRRPSANPLARWPRTLLVARTLRLLESIQPRSGGYLEATPLTSFVLASLVGCGRGEHPVARACVRFLSESARADGSWPIDTNLATWLTSLAIDALAGGGRLAEHASEPERARLESWLAAQQLAEEHPYTHAEPGGWAWTDRPGGVPDADDTAGALVALAHLRGARPRERAGAWPGLRWLVRLQNRDGGIPTFCRGWSGLPFDRSCADLSAHALRAFAAWEDELDPRRRGVLARARVRAARYLTRAQRADGAWVPLWFGNQAAPQLENPLYGTTRVLKAAAVLRADANPALARGEAWLLSAQRVDGGFGGDRGVAPSIEETGLALEALCALPPGPARRAAAQRAALWLAEHTDEGRRFEPTPIGLYFAKLWYAERLYPVIFTVSALERAQAVLEGSAAHAVATRS